MACTRLTSSKKLGEEGMETAVLLALIGIGVLAPLAWAVSRRTAKFRERIRSAARQLGFDVVDGRWITGRMNGFSIQVGPFGPGSSVDVTVIGAAGTAAGILPDLDLPSVTVAEKLRGEEDVQTPTSARHGCHGRPYRG
jgi:hypothetical protein